MNEQTPEFFPYMYLIVCPQEGSMSNEDGNSIAYFKFGDAHEQDVRAACSIHNPTFAYFSLCNATTKTTGLGTLMKHYLQERHLKQPYGRTEWFFTSSERVIALRAWFRDEWDGKVISDGTWLQFEKTVASFVAPPRPMPNKKKTYDEPLEPIPLDALGPGQTQEDNPT